LGTQLVSQPRWLFNDLSSRPCRTNERKSHTLFPNLHSFSNHLTTASNLLKSVQIPDILPADILPPNADFSFVAGDWEEVYGGRTESGAWQTEDQVAPEQRGQWGAVVTCFFIDTARNVMNYLAIIRGLLKDGGVWINVGPLLWHFENIADRERGEGGIELSLDEVKALARTMGFDLKVSARNNMR
jgi:carnosine N-methyltransferase